MHEREVAVVEGEGAGEEHEEDQAVGPRVRLGAVVVIYQFIYIL